MFVVRQTGVLRIAMPQGVGLRPYALVRMRQCFSCEWAVSVQPAVYSCGELLLTIAAETCPADMHLEVYEQDTNAAVLDANATLIAQGTLLHRPLPN